MDTDGAVMVMVVTGDTQAIGDQDGDTQVGDILDIGVMATTTTILTATEEEDLPHIMAEETTILTETSLQTEIIVLVEITPRTETSLQTEAVTQQIETILVETITQQDKITDTATTEEVHQLTEEPIILQVQLLPTEEIQHKVKTAVTIILTEDQATPLQEATTTIATRPEIILQALHHHALLITAAVAAEA